MPPSFLGGSPRSESVVWPQLLSNYYPALGEILCVPLRIEFFVSYSPMALLNASSTSVQRQMFWKFIFLVQDLQVGEPIVGLWSLSPWGESLQLWLFSHLWSTTQVTISLLSNPPIHVIVVLLFCLFSCRRYFLLLFRSILSTVALWIRILMCPWRR